MSPIRLLAYAYVLAVLGVPVIVGAFGIFVAGFGLDGVVLGGTLAFLILLLVARSRWKGNNRASAWLALLAAIAVGFAFAGTLLGGQFCAPRTGGCSKVPPEVDYRYDSDWHGWPIGWKTDMPEYAQDMNDWDETLILVGLDGISFPLLLMSLTMWFLMAAAGEAIAVSVWWLGRGLATWRGRSRGPPTTAVYG